MIQPGFLRELCRIRIELLLAARGAEIIFFPFVLARELCRLLIHGHLTNGINSHATPQVLPFLASGIYLLRRSESETTVTELAAIASAASSGRNMMPNDR